MEKQLVGVAKKFLPELESMSGTEYFEGVRNVIGFLYAAPLTLMGLVWLAAITNLGVLRTAWPLLLLLFVLLFLCERFNFFFFVEVTPGVYNDFQASLDVVITWSVVLIIGPVALWPNVLYRLFYYLHRWWRSSSIHERWSSLRNMVFNFAEILTGLIALALYEHLGGVYPVPGLTLQDILPAIAATLAWWLLPVLVWLLYLTIVQRSRVFRSIQGEQGIKVRFWVIMFGWPALVAPFAILAACLHAQHGLGVYVFFVSGLLLASWLAHHLSQAVERSQQRSRELEKLEQLGRALLNTSPEASALPSVLKEHVPNMFPHSQIEIHLDHNLFPDRTLLYHEPSGVYAPHTHGQVDTLIWDWLRTTPVASCFLPGEALPWEKESSGDAVVIVPILDVESAQPIGGIYIVRRWRAGTVANLLPAIQSLAAQVASALYRARVYTQTLAHQKVQHELALAWQIQESFLPADLPRIPGWQLAATLEPARQTSGDFYDVISLPNGLLGLVIADVADKGMGAALYMALSRTLIRTYALEYNARPELALGATNRRILADTQADLFVTIFFGVLDPATGTLTYCNAGHNPPYLLSNQNGNPVQALRNTGMPLGMFEDASWEQRVAHLLPGDVLVLYTDGVTEAQNPDGAFFGEERLLEVTQASALTAEGIRGDLLTAIREFAGDAPQAQHDDITLMIVVRD